VPEQVLPSENEIRRLVPSPGSAAWELAGDARLLVGAGYALLLQVSHPTVGAGVSEHSDFTADPWGRLVRTLDYAYAMTYGGPRLAGEIGRRVWEMHKRIRGVKPDGTRYHALEPEAYAWVHATLVEAIVSGHRRFGRRLRPDEVEELYADWRRSGRVVGVPEGELPESWAGFREYFDRMVRERLERTAAVQDVLATLTAPSAPPLPLLSESAWRMARLPAAHVSALATIGLLPPLLRERFGVGWSRGQERELRALSALSRAATPVLPPQLRNTGPGYLRLRRKALARGDVASAPPDSLASAA